MSTANRHFPVERLLGWRTMLVVLPGLTREKLRKWLTRGHMPRDACLRLAAHCAKHGVKWSEKDFLRAYAEVSRRNLVKRKAYLPRKL